MFQGVLRWLKIHLFRANNIHLKYYYTIINKGSLAKDRDGREFGCDFQEGGSGPWAPLEDFEIIHEKQFKLKLEISVINWSSGS